MPSGDLYRVQAFFNIGSELTECVWHFKETESCMDAIPAKSLLKTLAGTMGPFYGVASFSNESKLTVMHARRILPTTGIPYTIIPGAGGIDVIEGDGEEPPVPSQAAALVSLYTEETNRSGIGRYYLPGLDSGAQDDGQLRSVAVTELQEFADALMGPHAAIGPDTGTWRQHVYSRKLNSSALVTAAIAQSNMATIKGRRNFPGSGG